MMPTCTGCGRLRHPGQLLVDGKCGDCSCATRNGALAWIAHLVERTLPRI